MFVLTFLSTNLFAASSGYIYQGETYYLYKDGVKVQDFYIPRYDEDTHQKALFFSEDDFVRCYYWDTEEQNKKSDKNIHCIKKDPKSDS